MLRWWLAEVIFWVLGVIVFHQNQHLQVIQFCWNYPPKLFKKCKLFYLEGHTVIFLWTCWSCMGYFYSWRQSCDQTHRINFVYRNNTTKKNPKWKPNSVHTDITNVILWWAKVTKKRGTLINLCDLLTIQPAWSKPAERACSHPLDKRVGRKHPATPGMPAFLHWGIFFSSCHASHPFDLLTLRQDIVSILSGIGTCLALLLCLILTEARGKPNALA